MRIQLQRLSPHGLETSRLHMSVGFRELSALEPVEVGQQSSVVSEAI